MPLSTSLSYLPRVQRNGAAALLPPDDPSDPAFNPFYQQAAEPDPIPQVEEQKWQEQANQPSREQSAQSMMSGVKGMLPKLDRGIPPPMPAPPPRQAPQAPEILPNPGMEDSGPANVTPPKAEEEEAVPKLTERSKLALPKAPDNGLMKRLGFAILASTRLGPENARRLINPKYSAEMDEYGRQVGARTTEIKQDLDMAKADQDRAAAMKSLNQAQYGDKKFQIRGGFMVNMETGEQTPLNKTELDRYADALKVPGTTEDQAREYAFNKKIAEHAPNKVTNSYEGLLQQFMGPDGKPDYAKANAAWVQQQRDSKTPQQLSVEKQFIDKYLLDNGLPASAESLGKAIHEYAKVSQRPPIIQINTNEPPGAAAEMVANYQTPWNNAIARMGPADKEAFAQQVKKLNPDFQASNFNTYMKTENDFTSGLEGRRANALNTMMGHLDVLDQASDALKNGDIQILNRIGNMFSVQVGNDPVTTYKAIIHRLSPEIATAYVNAGGTGAERGVHESDFDPGLGIKQIKANIGVSALLADSKVKALQDQYARGTFGKGKQKLLTEEAERARHRLSSQSGIKRTYTQADIDAAVSKHKGLTPEAAEAGFKSTGAVRR